MRAVFVNHCHPEMDHVCAIRLRAFAQVLAGRGHRIVLLCGSGSGTLSISDHRRSLADYDWNAPYVLPSEPVTAPLLQRLRDGRLPGGLRQAVVAGGYLFQSGVFSDWRKGAQAAAGMLAEEFAPDVVWATFGNTDAWNIAQHLARCTKCPWVADLKDNWDHYIPAPFRNLLAGRYGDAAHFTALSQGHADQLSQRFGVSASVVYSGFGAPEKAVAPEPEGIRLVIAGSVYDGRALALMVEGIGAWLSVHDVEICYFGNDHERARSVLSPLDGRCRVTVRPWLEPEELAPILSVATAILSPRHPPMLYHHKFGDYIATGRPVICLPGETAECRNIAEDCNAPLFSCDGVEDVRAALSAIVAGEYPVLDKDRLAAYGWSGQAVALENVFAGIIKS